ncbi:TetR/AcrR family transcriptional regulator [Deinococcus wulumuqiensis]|uniref:TetR/AcrR family transcriptional regulator n=1 Tax=Deinococcus wulumuqiensis TaxID=980427 RepID=UPI002431710C|nr:TetR/AcrR family transcriptional regulator [Deinococcus wulumuqiensis]
MVAVSFPPPSPRAPFSSPETTRERIQTEAARLFVASGYHGVSMREVAEAVGVTKPALYHHYADKEALFLAMLDGALATLGRLVEHARQEQGIRAQLDTLIRDLLDTAPEQRVGLQLASELRHVSPERRAAFEGEYRRVWMGGLTTLIEEAAERGELRTDLPPSVLTRALLALTYPLVSGPPMREPHQAAQALLSVYLDGAAPR